MMAQPIQPLIKDSAGVMRFKANAIVEYLLDNGGIDMNQIAVMNFSQEDREQFAQLIGYSWSGACDLSYMSDEVLLAAKETFETGKPEAEARADILKKQLHDVREKIRDGVAELFSIHPDDLKPGNY